MSWTVQHVCQKVFLFIFDERKDFTLERGGSSLFSKNLKRIRRVEAFKSDIMVLKCIISSKGQCPSLLQQ